MHLESFTYPVVINSYINRILQTFTIVDLRNSLFSGGYCVLERSPFAWRLPCLAKKNSGDPKRRGGSEEWRGALASELIALSTEWRDELPLAKQVSLRLQLLPSGNIHFHQLRCAQPEPNSGQKNGGCIGAKQAPVDSDRSDLGIHVVLTSSGTRPNSQENRRVQFTWAYWKAV
jgi:hypothetical protein